MLRLATILLLLAGGSLVSPQPAVASDGGLVFAASARYELIPSEQRVRVTIDGAATSLTPDSATQRFYYTAISIPAPPGAANPVASADGIRLAAAVTESTEELSVIEVTFAQGIFYQQTYRFTLSFDIVDTGGAAARDVRIGSAFAAFVVWGFGDPGTAAEVDVALPPGFRVTLLAGEMVESTTPDGTVLSAPSGSDAGTFFAYVTAELPSARITEELTVTVGDEVAEIQLSAWPDDPAWVTLVSGLLVDGLPEMSEQIGLPYPLPGRLTVSEQAFGRLGNYAGTFDPLTDAIDIRYDTDAFVALHEAAHIWFNGDLFMDRWIGEAFASYYAELVAAEIGVEVEPFVLTPELAESAFPLNDWGEVGREDLDREDYAYSATNEVARRIADIAGPDGLRAVWEAADTAEFAYQPAGAETPERGEPSTSEGWQRMLDLLEERTGSDFDPIWVEFVVNDEEADLLAERDATRQAYAEAVTAADGWALPRSLRLLMGGWQFDEAADAMVEVHDVLEDRERIEAQADALGLEMPDDLRSTFEADGVDAAEQRAAAEMAALESIAGAGDRLAPELVPVEWVGLLGETTPETTLDAARSAYEAGDADEAVRLAAEAELARDAADDRGTVRVIAAGGGLLALDAAAVGGLVLLRRRAAAGRKPASSQVGP